MLRRHLTGPLGPNYGTLSYSVLVGAMMYVAGVPVMLATPKMILELWNKKIETPRISSVQCDVAFMLK